MISTLSPMRTYSAFATPRMVAFRPGQSPPAVRMPTRFFIAEPSFHFTVRVPGHRRRPRPSYRCIKSSLKCFICQGFWRFFCKKCLLFRQGRGVAFPSRRPQCSFDRHGRTGRRPASRQAAPCPLDRARRLEQRFPAGQLAFGFERSDQVRPRIKTF